MKNKKFSLEDVVYKTEKLAIFIDGANLYGASKALGFEIDYRKLKREFCRSSQLLRIYYYTALVDDVEYTPVKPLVDWLDYNGYTLVTKPVREYADVSGRRRVRGDMDIDLAVDAMLIADSVDHIIIFSGDGDYKRLVSALKYKGCRVSIVSTILTQPPMIGDELRRQTDNFIELSDMRPLIERAEGGRSYDNNSTALVESLSSAIADIGREY